MKASKMRLSFVNCGLKALALITFVLGMLTAIVHWNGAGHFCDLGLRYNELCCTWKGVNPFHVWDGTKTCEGFCGIKRPDRVWRASAPGVREVHAYPAWHTTYLIWMPLFSWHEIWWGYSVLSMFLLVALFVCFYLNQPHETDLRVWYWCAISSIAPYVPSAYLYGNYGIILAALAAVFIYLYQRKYDVWAGIVWSLMMIKPQVSFLIVIPCLLQRRFVVVIVAAAVCCLALIPPSVIYGESPIDLVLQIPEIGKPYVGRLTCGATHHLLKAMFAVAGTPGIWLWTFGVVALSTFATYKIRHVDSAFALFAPVFVASTLWTYSSPYDATVLWASVCGIYSMLRYYRGPLRAHTIVKCASLVVCVCSLFTGAWTVFVFGLSLFHPMGIGWMYWIMSVVFLVTFFATSLIMPFGFAQVRVARALWGSQP